MEKMVIDNFNSVFKNTNTFITGHTGFKGSWLALWLCSLHSNVSGFSLEAEKESHWNDLETSIVNNNIGDIRNYNFVEDSLLKADPEIIFHLAAQPLVRESYKNPIDTWETNVIGTANLLQACRKLNNIKAIIVITSDKCYENIEIDKGYKESDRLGGHDPYSSSKAAVEVLVSSFRRSYFSDDDSPKLVTARAGNVVGGGDWSKNRLIPDLVRSSISGNTLSIRYPKSTRPWQHVFDCLNGYIYLGTKLSGNYKKFSGSYNFGPLNSSKISVLNLSKKISKYLKTDYILKKNKKNIYLESKVLQLDTNKSKKLLNYSAKMNFMDTINYTVNWYKNSFNKKEDMFKFSLKQITNFYKTKY